MAKKKGTRQSNVTAATDNQKPPETVLSRQSSMEDHEDSSVQNLKSLNAILLKQTMENRHQIESLVQVKNEMETELTRYGSEETGLRDELEQVSDENFGLKMELGLVMDLVSDRFREVGVGVGRLVMEKDDRESEIRVLKSEVSEVMSKVEIEKEELRKVCDEKDSIKNGFDLKCEEVVRLKESVVCLEEKESDLEIVIEKLKSKNDGLVKERKMREEVIDGVNKEKIDLEKMIEEKSREIDGCKREIEVVLSDKSELEIVKIDQRKEIEVLEIKLDNLNESVKSLTMEEKVLRGLVIGLEKNLDESMEKESAMLVQIDALEKEKTIKESELERVMEEKNFTEKQMEMAYVHSSDKEKLIDQLSREKIELEERIFSHEAKLVELNQKADELTRFIAVLQKDCNDRGKTNEKLSCQVGELSYALEQVEVEREKADKAFDEEKRHGEDLKAEVLKSKKIIETTVQELEKVKIELESFFAAKNHLESQSESLKSEKAILEKELVEHKNAMDTLKTELESVGMDAKQSLVMLKSAASIMSQSGDREASFTSEQQEQENGTKSYTLELESIEKAFKNKENIINEMKKEAETMKQSTEEAHKKKSFWTLVSSVTTIFAAASFAYAARTR